MNVIETVQSLNTSKNPNTKLEQIITREKNDKAFQNVQTHIEENSTTITNLAFLNKSSLEPTPENLNKIPQDTKALSTQSEANNSQNKNSSQITKKKTFIGRTKEWAGNVWNSIKKFQFRKIFAKPEYKVFRNSNGDIVKIPVKKIPLKKKQENALREKRIKISQEQNGIVCNYLL